MEEKELQQMASQLSCPQGEVGIDVGNKMSELNQFITEKTIEKLSAKSGESIVEIGPGNALLSLPVLKAVGSDGYYTGIEMSDTMAVQARQNLNDYAEMAEIMCGDCLSVNIDSASVDAVMAVNVLYFIEDLPSFFKRIVRWLKQDGRVVFGIRSDAVLKALPFTQYGFNIRSADEIRLIMLQAGFSSVDLVEYDEGVSSFGEMQMSVDSIIIVGKKS